MERAEAPNRQAGIFFRTSRSASFHHSLRFLSLTISFLGALIGENISKSYAQESGGNDSWNPTSVRSLPGVSLPAGLIPI